MATSCCVIASAVIAGAAMERARGFNGAPLGVVGALPQLNGALSELQWSAPGAAMERRGGCWSSPRLQWSFAGASMELARGCNGAPAPSAAMERPHRRLQWSFIDDSELRCSGVGLQCSIAGATDNCNEASPALQCSFIAGGGHGSCCEDAALRPYGDAVVARATRSNGCQGHNDEFYEGCSWKERLCCLNKNGKYNNIHKPTWTTQIWTDGT